MYTIYVKFNCVPDMREAFVEKMKTEGILEAIRAENGNTLVFCWGDGTQAVKRWKDRSRAESWTEEMREAARQKTLARTANK